MNDNMALSVQGLSKSFDKIKVLNNINLDVTEGSSLVIVGRSGSGKSVLVKCINNLIEKDSGSVKFFGHDINRCTNKQKQKILADVGFLFQGGALFDSLNVCENITFRSAHLLNLTNQTDIRENAENSLKQVGLSGDILNLFPAELSGGMQKRVALARAISSSPKIIFFDEPTTGLDPIMVNVINDLIIDVREKLKVTTITITHDLNTINSISTHIAMLYNTEIIWHNRASLVKDSDNLFLQQFIKGSVKGPIDVV